MAWPSIATRCARWPSEAGAQVRRVRWPGVAAIEAIHDAQIAEHGGLPGLRDRGLLDSALARPAQILAYGEGDLFDLAAACAHGIARNHPFVDGNKRTAFLAAYLFLGLNGRRIVADETDVVAKTDALAAGTIDEAGFASWLRKTSKRT